MVTSNQLGTKVGKSSSVGVLGLLLCGIRNIDKGDLVGLWSSQIDTSEFKGTEYLKLEPNNTVKVVDSLNYSHCDSKLVVSVNGVLVSTGTWRTENRNFYLKLDSTEVVIDTTSFRIEPLVGFINIDPATENYIRHDFCNLIIPVFYETFSRDSCNEHYLGDVRLIGDDTLMLSNNQMSIKCVGK